MNICNTVIELKFSLVQKKTPIFPLSNSENPMMLGQSIPELFNFDIRALNLPHAVQPGFSNGAQLRPGKQMRMVQGRNGE